MRFLLDHDVPSEIGVVLKLEGHDVVQLREVLAVDSTDQIVFRYAYQDGRMMVTCNRDDFLQLARMHPHHGLPVMVRRRSRQAECGHLLALLDRAGESGLAHNINFA